MELRHRKILEEICYLFCNMTDSSSCLSSDCNACHVRCSIYYPPPSPKVFYDYVDPDNPHKTHKISTVLAVVIALLAAAFFALLCFAVYRRFLYGCFRRRSSETEEDTRGDFLDEEHGPVVDHPIWYIRTPGLQQSIISAITVCKYKKGEGLIEGTECSVCLSEFEEDENLRLLPKCNHAFHLPCIDTWLRSHTNCPLCRAPIVTDPATVITSPESNVVTSTDSEQPQIEIVENGSENSGAVENSVGELRNRDEEEGERRREMVDEEEAENLQPRRRSVSLDSSSVAKISRALAGATAAGSSVESSSSSKRVSKSSSSSFRIKSLQIVAGTSMKRSRSYNGKNLHSGCRSQRKPSVPVRSF